MTTDTIHYVRLPKGMGARAESVRMVYVLAGKPYVDALHAFQDVGGIVAGRNPFKQLPMVVTGDGRTLYQTLAIFHHAAHGTAAWPADPTALEQALAVWQGAYDLYQFFGGFAATDLPAKERFEQRRAPQFFGALGEIYASRDWAAGGAPTFADVMTHQAIAWCVRRNEVCKGLLEQTPSLKAFMTRFEAVPAIAAFMAKQAAARAVDDSV
jgi:glutathione S-transferase